MAAKFFALLTNQGAAKLSNMAALGEKLEITSLAVGDGGGVSPTPNQAQTELVNERRRAQLNSLSVDEKNTSQIIAEQIIPESVGGWWIREIGLFDADGVLIAVANCPETYKATTEEGSGRTQVIRMMLTVSSTDAVTLKVDPSVVLATRQYVDSAVIEVKTYADNVMKKHVAEDNPHSQYPLIQNALKELADAGLVGEVLKNLGLGEVALAGVMSAVLSDGGRLTLPVIINGARREVLIQWGQMPCSNLATTTTAFPVPFPFTCLKVVGWGYQVAGSIQAYAVLNGFNRNSFTWNAFYAPAGSAPTLATAAAVNIHYIAIGY